MALFVDSVNIRCKAGNGGNGCVSFHREKFVWKDYSPEDEDKLNKELERAAQLEKEKRRLEEEFRKI